MFHDRRIRVIMKNKRLLFISPHPDDESIFWGGTIAKYVNSGADVFILLLSMGERGRRCKITKEGKKVVMSDSKRSRSDLARIRMKEFQKAVSVLGVSADNLIYGDLPDTQININAIPIIGSVLDIIDPHIVISMNEAGTTRSSNPDHAWSGFATFISIVRFLSGALDKSRRISFQRFFTYILPDVDKFFNIYSEIFPDSLQLSKIDVRDTVHNKNDAVKNYFSQGHIIRYFEERGILDVKEEHFVERIGVRDYGRKRTDFFEGINLVHLSSDYITGEVPLSVVHYMSSDRALYELIDKQKSYLDEHFISL
jgi:LmbE family N-acetylglucosaminyl deacetylase